MEAHFCYKRKKHALVHLNYQIKSHNYDTKKLTPQVLIDIIQNYEIKSRKYDYQCFFFKFTIMNFCQNLDVIIMTFNVIIINCNKLSVLTVMIMSFYVRIMTVDFELVCDNYDFLVII